MKHQPFFHVRGVFSTVIFLGVVVTPPMFIAVLRDFLHSRFFVWSRFLLAVFVGVRCTHGLLFCRPCLVPLFFPKHVYSPVYVMCIYRIYAYLSYVYTCLLFFLHIVVYEACFCFVFPFFFREGTIKEKGKTKTSTSRQPKQKKIAEAIYIYIYIYICIYRNVNGAGAEETKQKQILKQQQLHTKKNQTRSAVSKGLNLEPALIPAQPPWYPQHSTHPHGPPPRQSPCVCSKVSFFGVRYVVTFTRGPPRIHHFALIFLKLSLFLFWPSERVQNVLTFIYMYLYIYIN